MPSFTRAARREATRPEVSRGRLHPQGNRGVRRQTRADSKLWARFEAAEQEFGAASAKVDGMKLKLGHEIAARGGQLGNSEFSGQLAIHNGASGAAKELADYLAANPEAANAPSGAKVVSSLIESALSRPVNDGFRAALDGGSLGARTYNAADWVDLPRRRLSVLDLIPIGGEVQGLGGEKLQYFKTTVRTNNAATVAALAEKPESVLTVSREETDLWTYAHISEQVPLQFLYAASGLQEYIEQDMGMSVLEAHEADILSGTGTTEIDGITNVAGTLTQASTGDPFRDIRKGLTQLQNANIIPDALVLNPTDAERLDLETDAEGQYHMGGPLAEAAPRLWRVPIIVTTGLTAGTAILGNFRLGAVRWVGVSRIEWGRINTDFQYNALRLVAEVGASAAVCRPGAFVKVSF